tara:strand:- start:662 stop:958 length:297 start_codon:yes stop_codon:yes gene_type:complete
MLFSAKTIARDGNFMVNMCDPELLDKTVSDGTVKVKINKNYYHEKLIDKDEAAELLKKSNSINLVGNATIDLSLNLGIGSKQGIKLIDGIPFLIIIKM